LAIGRALMSNPRLLLFDEPSTGLAPLIAEQMMAAIAALNKDNTTVLLVEQNVYLALEFVHRGYVLENGRTIRSGSAEELRNDGEIKRSYLGG
ncbi:MAG: ABC transporter ATP-binding protein, partial [Methylocella sp.]